MKVVVDEGVPRNLVVALRAYGLDARRLPREWLGLSNGKLVSAADDAEFQGLLTNDRNMASQTNLRGRRIRVVALPSTKASMIEDRARDIADTIAVALPGRHTVIDMNGKRTAWPGMKGNPGAIELEAVAPFKF